MKEVAAQEMASEDFSSRDLEQGQVVFQGTLLDRIGRVGGIWGHDDAGDLFFLFHKSFQSISAKGGLFDKSGIHKTFISFPGE